MEDFIVTTGPISVGGLQFDAHPAWVFYPFDDFILARRDRGVGTFQIALAYRNAVKSPATHAACVATARKFVRGDVIGDPFDIEAITKGDVLFGAVSHHVRTEFERLWYLHRSQELVVSSYCCKWDDRAQPQVQKEVGECGHMAFTFSLE